MRIATDPKLFMSQLDYTATNVALMIDQHAEYIDDNYMLWAIVSPSGLKPFWFAEDLDSISDTGSFADDYTAVPDSVFLRFFKG